MEMLKRIGMLLRGMLTYAVVGLFITIGIIIIFAAVCFDGGVIKSNGIVKYSVGNTTFSKFVELGSPDGVYLHTRNGGEIEISSTLSIVEWVDKHTEKLVNISLNLNDETNVLTQQLKIAEDKNSILTKTNDFLLEKSLVQSSEIQALKIENYNLHNKGVVKKAYEWIVGSK